MTAKKNNYVKIGLTELQKAKLDAEADRLSISMALVIRQFIDSLPAPDQTK